MSSIMWEFQSSTTKRYYAVIKQDNKWFGCSKVLKEEAKSRCMEIIRDASTQFTFSKRNVYLWLKNGTAIDCVKQTDIPRDLLSLLGIGNNEQLPATTVVMCDCGAKHTSNPNCHAQWCSTQQR